MHELGVTQAIVESVLERTAPARVARVVLRIGKLSAILPDAVRFCFDLCTEGTAMEGATLQIIETPGRVRCRTCGLDAVVDRPVGLCACGSIELDWIEGEELILQSVELHASSRAGIA